MLWCCTYYTTEKFIVRGVRGVSTPSRPWEPSGDGTLGKTPVSRKKRKMNRIDRSTMRIHNSRITLHELNIQTRCQTLYDVSIHYSCSPVSQVSKTCIEGRVWAYEPNRWLDNLCRTVTTVLEEILLISIIRWPPLRLRSHWVTRDGVLRKVWWRQPMSFWSFIRYIKEKMTAR